MPTVKVYNMSGKAVGEINLNEAIFGAKVNVPLMHEVVKAYLANQRQGTQSALTRSEVSGGGAKPYRQKGTGRARHGSTRSPQWRHGGVVFAPKPRSYRLSINKKAKRVAMFSALSSKALDGSIIVLDELNLAAPKTKEMINLLGALKVHNALIVLPEPNDSTARAARNIQGVNTTIVGTLNVYNILKHETLILTKATLEKLEEVYA